MYKTFHNVVFTIGLRMAERLCGDGVGVEVETAVGEGSLEASPLQTKTRNSTKPIGNDVFSRQTKRM